MQLNYDELKLIEKYRSLDGRGRNAVDWLLDHEAARVTALLEQTARIKKYAELILEYRESSLTAAQEHTDTPPAPEDQEHEDSEWSDHSKD